MSTRKHNKILMHTIDQLKRPDIQKKYELRSKRLERLSNTSSLNKLKLIAQEDTSAKTKTDKLSVT